jgi:hypothetical protein
MPFRFSIILAGQMLGFLKIQVPGICNEKPSESNNGKIVNVLIKGFETKLRVIWYLITSLIGSYFFFSLIRTYFYTLFIEITFYYED